MKKKQEQLFAPDPFEYSTIAYKYYCLAHGAKSPEEMQRIEYTSARPRPLGFLEWFRQQYQAAEAAGVAGGWPPSNEWIVDWVLKGRHLTVGTAGEEAETDG